MLSIATGTPDAEISISASDTDNTAKECTELPLAWDFTLKPLGGRIFELGNTGCLLFLDKPDISAIKPDVEKRIQN